MGRRLAALFSAAALLIGARPAAADSPSLAGVWDGTIGILPVRVCFNEHDWGTTGGYYYRSHLEAIWFDGSDKAGRSFTEGMGEPDASTPRWTISAVRGDTLSGTWTQRGKHCRSRSNVLS